MGLVNGTLVLRIRRPDVARLEVRALVDTAATFLCIPQRVCDELHLDAIESKCAALADGSSRRVPYVGPVELRFKDRVGFAGALVMGDEVLLGAIPMEDMNLIVVPRTQTLAINPDSNAVSLGVRAADRSPSKSSTTESLSRVAHDTSQLHGLSHPGAAGVAPLSQGAVDGRLMAEISRIRAIDNHTHADPVDAARGQGWNAAKPLASRAIPTWCP